MPLSETFRNVASFQVLTPDTDGALGWMKFRPSFYTESDVWHCEWTSQDGSASRRKLITSRYAENVWERYHNLDTCETTWLEGVS
jgi:hypothetical protein